ncbi:MAG: hypothetical protein R3F61_29285 [Myxococcota bacterium]
MADPGPPEPSAGSPAKPARERLALALFYGVSALVMLGGLGDLAITDLLDAQEAMLSGNGAYPISPPARTVFLTVLHAMAGGLVGVGAASLLMTHFGIRRGHGWAVAGVAVAIGGAESANTLGMFTLGSPFWVITATYLGLLAVAVGLWIPSMRSGPNP